MSEISAGELVVAITAKLNEFKTGIQDATKQLTDFGKSADGVKKDTRGIGDAFTETGKDISRFAGNAKESVDSFVKMYGADVKTLGLAIGAFGVAITGSLALSIKAASEHEDVWRRLQAQIELTGNSWIDAKPKIDEFTASIEASTRYSDEEAGAVLQKMLIYTSDLGEAFKGTSLAIDMAATGMFTAESAARYIGMAMNGNIEMLGRWIPELRVSTNEQLKNMDANERGAYAMELLTAKFGGAAQKDVATFSGRMEQLGSFIGEIAENIGNVFLPALTTLAEIGRDIAKGVDEFMDKHEGLTTFAVTLAAGLGLVSLALSAVALFVVTALPTLLSALEFIGVTLGVAGPIGIGIAAFLVGLALVVTYWDEITAAFKAGYDTIIKPVVDDMGILFSGFWKDTKVILGYLSEKFLEVLGIIGKGWLDIGGLLVSLIGFILDSFDSLVTSVYNGWLGENGIITVLYEGVAWLMEKLGIELPKANTLFGDIQLTGTGAAEAIRNKWAEFTTKFSENMENQKSKHAEETNLIKAKDEQDKDDYVIDEKTKNAEVEAADAESQAIKENAFAFSVERMIADEDAKKDAQKEAERLKVIALYDQIEAEWGGLLSAEDIAHAQFLVDTGGDWEAFCKETYENSIPAAFQRGMTNARQEWNWGIGNMASDLMESIAHGGMSDSLEFLKQGFLNIFGGILAGFSETVMTGISTKVSGFLSGLGTGISGLAGQLAGLGAVALAATVVNLVGAGFTPDYEAARKERERKGAKNRMYYTTEGIKAELKGSEWAFSLEAMYQMRDEIAELMASPLSKLPNYPQYAQLKGLKEKFGDLEEAAAAGYGFQAIMESISVTPAEGQAPLTLTDIFGGRPPTFADIIRYGRKTAAYQNIPSMTSAIGTYHIGGIIEGITGTEKLIRALAGEEIITRSDPRHSLNFGGGLNVYISGNNINSDLDMQRLGRIAGNEIMKSLKLQTLMVR